MYCESTAAQYPMDSENHKLASTMVMDFWGRVTPGILQMLNTPKEVLHFLDIITEYLCFKIGYTHVNI